MELSWWFFIGVGYITFLTVAIHAIVTRSATQTPNIFRISLAIPGMIAMFALAQGGGFMLGFGVDQPAGIITTHGGPPLVIHEKYTFGVDSSNIPHNVTSIEAIVIEAPVAAVWSLWHLMLGLLLFFYVAWGVLGLLLADRVARRPAGA